MKIAKTEVIISLSGPRFESESFEYEVVAEKELRE
jgi:hypothetical protein